MVNHTLLNIGKRYNDNLRVISDQWLKLHVGLDALSYSVIHISIPPIKELCSKMAPGEVGVSLP